MCATRRFTDARIVLGVMKKGKKPGRTEKIASFRSRARNSSRYHVFRRVHTSTTCLLKLITEARKRRKRRKNDKHFPVEIVNSTVMELKLASGTVLGKGCDT